ncbi:hypothetical protein ACLMJK_000561 [Lecanora helva]
MVPPPITPSPNRFITTQPTTHTQRPASSLRFQQQQPRGSSSSQFASTPRFNFSSSQKPTKENATPGTQYSSPLSRRPHLPASNFTKNKDDIEETGSEHDDDDLHEEDPSHPTLSTQQPSKRRRPNPTSEPITISSSPSPSPPSTPPLLPLSHHKPPLQSTTPHPTAPHQTPRFVLPISTPSTGSTIPSRPPLILPPARSPSPQPDDLPAFFFSPHRRGQRYNPGGLASTARDWILETAQGAYAGRGKGQEGWDVKVRVGECLGGDVGVGMVLVREMGEGMGWVLVGTARGEGEVGVRKVVGIREPIWEIEMGKEGWRVGVEWGVLDR